MTGVFQPIARVEKGAGGLTKPVPLSLSAPEPPTNRNFSVMRLSQQTVTLEESSGWYDLCMPPG